MAAVSVLKESVNLEGKLEAATPSLQNCIRYSNTWRFLSILCDCGVVLIAEMKAPDSSGDSSCHSAVVVKRLTFGKGDTLEGHTWSSDDELFAAAAGRKIHIFKASTYFSCLHNFSLYYIPKDVSLVWSSSITCHDSLHAHSRIYSLAVAGPNGVDLYEMEIDRELKGESLSLHSDLAIALVEFSPDKKYLAVAALDCHFGIWTISSLVTDRKEFWYVHLKTMRITSLEFSPNSNMIAVAGWEGSWHLYRKMYEGGRLTWLEVHRGQGSVRVSGDLPGSFVNWSPDNRYVRLTQSSEKKCCLSTFDTQTSALSVISLDQPAKGMATFRERSGDYSLCLLNSRQFLAMRWPTSQPGQPRTSPDIESEQRVLLSQDSILGSLQVERAPNGGVTLILKPKSIKCMNPMKNMDKEDIYGREEPQQSEVTVSSFGPVKEETNTERGRESNQGATDVVAVSSYVKQDYGPCDISETGCYSESVVLAGSEQAEDEKHCESESASHWTKNDEKTDDFSTAKNIGGRKEISDREACLLSSKPSAAESQSGVLYILGSLHQNSQYGSETGNNFYESTDNLAAAQKKCDFKTESLVSSSLRSDVLRIEAPFLNPAAFSSCNTTSGLWSLQTDTQVLFSTKYVIVAILPLLAHIYHHSTQQWKTLLFPSSVVNCGVMEDKYLVLLTVDGRIKIWYLDAMKMLHISNEVIVGKDKLSRRK